MFYVALLPHICHNIASAMDFIQIFLSSGILYLTLLLDIWNNVMLHQPAFKGSLGAGSSSLKLQAFQMWFKIQTRSTCLFESHSVHQKVLLWRFYLCVKALRNTISTSFRFWTHSLIASYGDSCISYPLGHWSL